VNHKNIRKTLMVQDLKDFSREAGDVVYTNVNGDGTGVVEFSKESHLEYALKNFNDKKFRSHLVSK
jgi:arginine/serine-rich splicing factor 1/9